MKIEIIKRNSRFHFLLDDNLIISSGYNIARFNPLTLSTQCIGSLPISFYKKILSKSRLFGRLLRMGVHHVLFLGKYNSFIAVAEKGIYLKKGDCNFELLKNHRMRSRPLPQGVCIDNEENVYYGEYWGNPERSPVYLYRSNDGGVTWTVQHTFENDDRIRHVHSVQYDLYEDKLWVTTGDSDSECGIYCSGDQGKTLEGIGKGDKSWCAVSLIFTDDYVYWGTDSPQTRNWIYRYHRRNGTRERLGEMPGPVYYSTKAGDRLVFATAVENVKKESDGSAHILTSTDGIDWFDAVSFEKDIWPTLFQYGTINFGKCSFTGDIFLNPLALKRIDNNICRMVFDSGDS